jgi:selenocysteine lyase/cysteine desulfurase
VGAHAGRPVPQHCHLRAAAPAHPGGGPRRPGRLAAGRGRRPGAVDAGTDLVAFSAVESATGAVADLAAVRDAARHHGARTLVDATQGCGWLPLAAGDWDHLVCATYKWLLTPRGCAFLALRPGGWRSCRPSARAGSPAAVRDGGVRVSCHLYNTPQDVDTALDALGC